MKNVNEMTGLPDSEQKRTDMKGKSEMTEETINIEANEGCPACLTIPVSHLALEVDPPLGGWQNLFEKMGIKVVVDPAGREAIVTVAARRLMAFLKRQDELAVEANARRNARLAAKYPVRAGGIPAPREGMTAAEVMATSPGYQTPQDEYQGIPRPRFLQEELAEGERALAGKKREAAAKAKQRLTDQMKDNLGGKGKP